MCVRCIWNFGVWGVHNRMVGLIGTESTRRQVEFIPLNVTIAVPLTAYFKEDKKPFA